MPSRGWLGRGRRGATWLMKNRIGRSRSLARSSKAASRSSPQLAESASKLLAFETGGLCLATRRTNTTRETCIVAVRIPASRLVVNAAASGERSAGPLPDGGRADGPGAHRQRCYTTAPSITSPGQNSLQPARSASATSIQASRWSAAGPGVFGRVSERLARALAASRSARKQKWMREQGPGAQSFGYIENGTGRLRSVIFFTSLRHDVFWSPPWRRRRDTRADRTRRVAIPFGSGIALVELPQALVSRRRRSSPSCGAAFPGRAGRAGLGRVQNSQRRRTGFCSAKTYGIGRRFVLYAGRIDQSRGGRAAPEFAS